MAFQYFKKPNQSKQLYVDYIKVEEGKTTGQIFTGGEEGQTSFVSDVTELPDMDGWTEITEEVYGYGKTDALENLQNNL